MVVGPYTHNEHTTRGPPDKSFEEAAFLERLRIMLVMEDGASLWLARGTPRAWLEQGKTVSVERMPSHFGPVTYRIVSDVDRNRITATVELPTRTVPREVVLRLRHPKAAAMERVLIDGKGWTDFDAAREVVRLHGGPARVRVEVMYAK